MQREKSLIKYKGNIFSISINTLPTVELYYSITYLAFETFDSGVFLVFRVLNAKMLAFSTSDANAFTT